MDISYNLYYLFMRFLINLIDFCPICFTFYCYTVSITIWLLIEKSLNDYSEQD
jgi:hypothetical protein